MLYRPLFLLSLLHSSFTAKHLTMHYSPMERSDGIYIHAQLFSFFFSPFLSLSLSLSTVSSARILMLTCPLVDRSDGYLRGTTREYRSQLVRSYVRSLVRVFFLLSSLSLLADVVIICVHRHRRSSFRSKVMVMPAFFLSHLCSVSSFFSPSSVYILLLAR